MFHTKPTAVTEPAPAEVEPAELIPLSHLALDLGEPSTGWASHLADRDIAVVIDDVGRASVARSDARLLFDERREAEARQREAAARNEQRLIEADQQRRAQLWGGISALDLPPDVRPAAAMLQAARDARPRRQSPLQHALSNEGAIVFHPIQGDES
jgi:hypothetical protein